MQKFSKTMATLMLLAVMTLFIGGEALGEDLNRIVVGTGESFGNLDPHVSVAWAEARYINVIYNPLVSFGKDASKVYPMLATSWEPSEDGLTWTFNLRDDVYFEDGTHFDSSVAKFSFDRLLSLGTGASEPFKVIEEVVALDPYTIQFVLKEQFAPFIQAMATTGGSIVPPSVMDHEKDGDWGKTWLAEHSLGSGPFRIKSWEKDQTLVIQAKQDYWGGEPRWVDEVVTRFILEPGTLKMELLVGTVDIGDWSILIEDIQDLAKNEDITIFTAPQFNYYFIFMNAQLAPFDDARVRKAVAYAIDYPAIVDGIMMGYASRMEGPWYLGMWNKTQELPLYERDLPLARQLLAEAGYPDGFTTTLAFWPEGNWPLYCSVIQSNLADIGIEVKLEQYAFPTYLDKVLGHELEMGILGVGCRYPDPDASASRMYESTAALNMPDYRSESIDNLLREGRTTIDQEDRADIYRRLQLYQHELLPYIYLFQIDYVFPMRSWVKGFYYIPNVWPLLPFQDMWIDKQ